MMNCTPWQKLGFLLQSYPVQAHNLQCPDSKLVTEDHMTVTSQFKHLYEKEINMHIYNVNRVI